MQKITIVGIFILLHMQVCSFHLSCMNNYQKYQNKILTTRIAQNKERALEKINDPENASDFFKCYGWLNIIPMKLEDINIIIDELLPVNFICTQSSQLKKKRKKKNKKQSKLQEEEEETYKKILMYFNYRFHHKVSNLNIYCSPPSDREKRLTLQYLAKKYITELENLEPLYTNFFIKYQQEYSGELS